MRSVILFLLATLFLGALANHARYGTMKRQGGGGRPPQNNSHPPQNGTGGGNGSHPSPPPPPPETLEQVIEGVCDNITKGCEDEGVSSSQDGSINDLCDNAFCKEWLPKNLCFFDCVVKCEEADDKEGCANECMQCGQKPPPRPPKEAIPQICDEVAKGCKRENKTSHNDNTVYDLCDAKHCKQWLPEHGCFFDCAWKCENEATGDEAQDEACMNECIACQEEDEEHEGDGNEGEGEGDVEGAGENDGEGETGEGNEEEQGEEAARAVIRTLRRRKHSQSFGKMFQRAQYQTQNRRRGAKVYRQRRTAYKPRRRVYTPPTRRYKPRRYAVRKTSRYVRRP